MRLTEETAKEIYNLFDNMCGSINCSQCVCYAERDIHFHCHLDLKAIRDALDYILVSQEPTNEEKFKETFGFPLYELHQLSAEEEREWSEKLYQKNNKEMD